MEKFIESDPRQALLLPVDAYIITPDDESIAIMSCRRLQSPSAREALVRVRSYKCAWFAN